MKTSRYTFVLAHLLFLAPFLQAADIGSGKDSWTEIFSDTFARGVPGADWLPVWEHGRGLTVRNASLNFSHDTKFICTVPLSSVDSRVAFTFAAPYLEREHTVRFRMRTGRIMWTGGGMDPSFGISVRMGNPEEHADTFIAENGVVVVPGGRPVAVSMEIIDGEVKATVDGSVVMTKTVDKTNVSEVSRYFGIDSSGFNSPPHQDATLRNFRMYARDRSHDGIALIKNSREENLLATRYLDGLAASDNPAVEIQAAIDSLPPAGGTVVLPEGVFMMRRHLRLRSGVNLIGQGAGRTVLQSVPGFTVPIIDLRASDSAARVRVAGEHAKRFRLGDGVSFGQMWGHPLSSHIDHVITDIDGDEITIAGVVPVDQDGQQPKELRHWFPLLFAREAEWVEARDLTLRGADNHESSMWGGFMNNPVTFGIVTGARLSRLEIDGWRGDGVSLQRSDDSMITDNTVKGTYQGLHPGTGTENLVMSRNLCVDNHTGLYVCYYNRNAIYAGNTLNGVDGYAWPLNVANAFVANQILSRPFKLEQGWVGVLFANQIENLLVGHGQEGAPTHHFVVAENQVGSIGFRDGNVRKIVYSANTTADGGAPLAIEKDLVESIVDNREPLVAAPGFRFGAGRDSAVPAPVLPEPVLDGREYYDHAGADCGFQAALDALAGGGTLLLPAGRYAIAKTLKLGSGTTLAGHGSGTVLYAADGFSGPIVEMDSVRGVAVREMVILGDYGRQADKAAAVRIKASEVEVVALDIRGWRGDGLAVEGGSASILDCRVIACAGAGLVVEGASLRMESTLARGCGTGGMVFRRLGADSKVIASTASWNRTDGFLIEGSEDILILGCNANNNNLNGYHFANSRSCRLVACTATDNGRQDAEANGIGIRLSKGAAETLIAYCMVADMQNAESQFPSVGDDETCARNTVRSCIAVSMARRHDGNIPDTIVLQGVKSEFTNCLRQ